MEVVNPSVMVSRLDLVVLDSAAAGRIFRRLLKGSGSVPWWVVPSSGLPLGATRAQHVPFGP